MKKWLAYLMLVFPLLTFAGGGINGGYAIIGQTSTALPTNCTVGELWFNTGVAAGNNVYGCTAANTWTLQTGGAGAAGGADTNIQYNSSGAFAGNVGFSFKSLNRSVELVTLLGSDQLGAAAGVRTYNQYLTRSAGWQFDSASGSYALFYDGFNTGSAAKVAQVSDGLFYISKSFGFAQPLTINTAPTISSGFGSSPSIASSNGTATFRVNVGTGGTASSGVVTMPTAGFGWNCFAADITNPGINDTKMSASNTTTVTLTNYNSTTGAAVAWTASDIIAVACFGY